VPESTELENEGEKIISYRDKADQLNLTFHVSTCLHCRDEDESWCDTVVMLVSMMQPDPELWAWRCMPWFFRSRQEREDAMRRSAPDSDGSMLVELNAVIRVARVALQYHDQHSPEHRNDRSGGYDRYQHACWKALRRFLAEVDAEGERALAEDERERAASKQRVREMASELD